MFTLLKKLFLYRTKNFTILREFKIDDSTDVKEYVYNMNTYLSDVWPPNTSERGFPIKSAVREADGIDVTERIKKFAGPRKNYVNPLGARLVTHRKRTMIQFINFGIRFSYDYYDIVWEPYEGVLIVTDIFDGIKKINLGKTNNNGAYIPS